MDEVTSGDLIEFLLVVLRKEKPGDRSELDRRYAILITDLEKIAAYHKVFIQDQAKV